MLERFYKNKVYLNNVYLGGISGAIFLLWVLSKIYGGKEIGINVILTTITILIIFFYLYETYRMRKEIVNQTKIQSTPFISFCIEEGINERLSSGFENSFGSGPVRVTKLFIRNNGEGCARNIKVTFKSLASHESLIDFQSIAILPKKETEELSIEAISEKEFGQVSIGSAWDNALINDLMSKSPRSDLLFEIRFMNIIEELYHIEGVIRNREFHYTKFVKD